MTLDLTTKATEQFVKFIYGFDIKWCGRNEVLKELLVYGGVYGLGCLQEAAESVLKNRLSSRNVIEFLEFAKEQRLERAVCLCVEFAARNRDKMKLSKETFKKYPEIAVEILQQEPRAHKTK